MAPQYERRSLQYIIILSEYIVHEFHVTSHVKAHDVFSSGQGSAVQAAGAESERNPTEDLQRDDRLDRAQHTRQTQSALTVLYIQCVRVQTCCSLDLFILLTALSLSLFVLLSSFTLFPSFPLFLYLVDNVSVCGLICLYPLPCLTCNFLYFLLFSSSCCRFVCHLIFICVSLSRSISRCWGPLCEHDSADQRSSPLLLLGGRQETFLHRQRQHGLEITGHCIYDSPHTHLHTHFTFCIPQIYIRYDHINSVSPKVQLSALIMFFWLTLRNRAFYLKVQALLWNNYHDHGIIHSANKARLDICITVGNT